MPSWLRIFNRESVFARDLAKALAQVSALGSQVNGVLELPSRLLFLAELCIDFTQQRAELGIIRPAQLYLLGVEPCPTVVLLLEPISRHQEVPNHGIAVNFFQLAQVRVRPSRVFGVKMHLGQVRQNNKTIPAGT